MATETPAKTRTIGVLLMTYGAAQTPEDVPAYLNHAYRGRAPQDLIEEFQRRYRLVGGSPLVETTCAQADALQGLLNERAGPEGRFLAEPGMQHTPPFIADALASLAGRGCGEVVAIVMSPQYSPLIMGGYHRAVDASKAALPEGVEVRVAGTWHLLPSFVEALAARVREAIDQLPPDARADVPVILTAHSLPESVVQREPHYIEQLMETARAVAAAAGLREGQWRFAYQSAGHSPEPWLTPDMKDLMPGIAAAGHRHVLMAPVQFLADHLETLYDIDVGARAEAEEHGLAFHRIRMFNADPAFIHVLAEVVRREVEIN